MHERLAGKRAQPGKTGRPSPTPPDSPAPHEPGAAPTRMLALILLTVTLGAVWLMTSPVARGWRLAQTPTDTLLVRAAARPDDVPLQLALGQRLVSEGRGAEALPALQRVMEKTGGEPSAVAAVGAALVQAGRDEEAFQHLRFALARGPRGDAHQALGALYLKHDRPDKALPELEKAVRLEPKSAEAWRLLAVARRGEGNWTEAAAALSRAVEHRLNDPVLRLDFAEALLETGQLVDAELILKRLSPYLSRGTEATPENRVRHRTLLARLYLEQGSRPENLRQAEAALREALVADPTRAATHATLADVLLRAERTAEAEAAARAALERDPKLLSARHLRARALTRLGRTQEAARERARFDHDLELDHQEMQLRGRLTLRPDDASLHERLGRLLRKRGLQSQAREELATARKLREGVTGRHGEGAAPAGR